ncbi:MAG: site-specific integrase [Erysipelotrichaceae bacterium]|nr:site-specific integrase [Erysipelotrichaceae bacterium]
MSVHKDKKRNTWYVKHNNKTKRGFVSKKEAQNYEMLLKSGEEQPQAKKQEHSFTFIADDFLRYKKNEVEYSSFSLYEGIVNNFIKPYFENRTINEIRELDCKGFKDAISLLDCSSRRKNKILQLCKNIFQYAVDYYELSSNPSLVMKPFNYKLEEKISSKKKELRIWNNDDFRKFINCVIDETYKALFLVLYLTGLRLGEALALTYNDIDEYSLSITKSQTKITENGSYEIKAPKNISSIRDVSINKSLYFYLLARKEEEKKKPDFTSSWFIFGGKDPLPRTSIERVKNKAVKEAGVKKIRLHDFRHSHASNLIGEGMDIVAVSKRLGHSNIEMTLNCYTHLLKKNEDDLTDYLEKSSHNLLTSE